MSYRSIFRISLVTVFFSLLLPPFLQAAPLEGKAQEASPPAIVYGSVEGVVMDWKTKQVVPAVLVRIDGGSIHLTAQTDNEGKYRFSQLLMGKYGVVAEKEGYNPTSGNITLANDVPLKVNIEIKAKSGFLDGVVRDETGKAIKGVQVTLMGTSYKMETDAEGAYAFYDLPIAEYSLSFEHAGYLTDATRKAVIFENSITTIKAILQPNVAGQVSGKVTDVDSTDPLVDVEVKVEVGENSVVGYTNADGSYLIKGLAPGRYRVTLSREGYSTKIGSVLVSDKEGKLFNFTLTPLPKQ